MTDNNEKIQAEPATEPQNIVDSATRTAGQAITVAAPGACYNQPTTKLKEQRICPVQIPVQIDRALPEPDQKPKRIDRVVRRPMTTFGQPLQRPAEPYLRILI